MTIGNKLLQLYSTKDDIKSAIRTMGGTVSDEPFREYPNKILEIPTGGGEGVSFGIGYDEIGVDGRPITATVYGSHVPPYMFNKDTSVKSISVWNDKITHVTLKPTVKHIGESALRGGEIGGSGDNPISSIDANWDNIETIGNYGLAYAQNTITGSLPKLSSVGRYGMVECKLTEDITLPYNTGSNAMRRVSGPVTITYSGKVLHSLFREVNVDGVVFTAPDGIIDVDAFAYAKIKETLIIPNHVHTIKQGAFNGGAGGSMKPLTLPENLTTLVGSWYDSGHFQYQTITNNRFPKKLTRIQVDGSFSSCRLQPIITLGGIQYPMTHIHSKVFNRSVGCDVMNIYTVGAVELPDAPFGISTGLVVNYLDSNAEEEYHDIASAGVKIPISNFSSRNPESVVNYLDSNAEEEYHDITSAGIKTPISKLGSDQPINTIYYEPYDPEEIEEEGNIDDSFLI